MSAATADFTGRYILVADEDPAVVALVLRTLRQDGHAVFHAYDARSAFELVYNLRQCDLVISNTRVETRLIVESTRLDAPSRASEDGRSARDETTRANRPHAPSGTRTARA